MAEATESTPMFGTFTKEGETPRVAHTINDRNLLLWNAWTETPTEEIKGDALDAALIADGQPTTGSADEKRARLTKS